MKLNYSSFVINNIAYHFNFSTALRVIENLYNNFEYFVANIEYFAKYYYIICNNHLHNNVLNMNESQFSVTRVIPLFFTIVNLNRDTSVSAAGLWP